MKAMVFHKYGNPADVLRQVELEKPTPKKDEVLLKVHTTPVNDYDWSMVRGKPSIYRLMYGLFRPKYNIPGMEVAGTIEGLGPGATDFKVGDDVYGDISEFGFGTFAEYLCINQKALIKKPKKMSFAEAASFSHAAMLAWQGFELGPLHQGQKILINGAGGGMGTFGLQIAKTYEAHVTGVDSGKKLNMMKELGFDEIIDYKQQDFTRNGEKYDLILDAKTTRWPLAHLRSLKTGGKYITVGGYLPRLLVLMLFKPFVALFSKKSLHLLPLKANDGLEKMQELYEQGKIKVMVDGPFKLAEAATALDYFGGAEHSGKVVLQISK